MSTLPGSLSLKWKSMIHTKTIPALCVSKTNVGLVIQKAWVVWYCNMLWSLDHFEQFDANDPIEFEADRKYIRFGRASISNMRASYRGSLTLYSDTTSLTHLPHCWQLILASLFLWFVGLVTWIFFVSRSSNSSHWIFCTRFWNSEMSISENSSINLLWWMMIMINFKVSGLDIISIYCPWYIEQFAHLYATRQINSEWGLSARSYCGQNSL